MLALSNTAVVPSVNRNGEDIVQVFFFQPCYHVTIRDNGDVDYDEGYIAMNKLDLLPVASVEQVRNKVQELLSSPK